MIIVGQMNLIYLFEKKHTKLLYKHFAWLTEHIGNQTVPGIPVKNFDAAIYAMPEEKIDQMTPELLITYGGHVVSKRRKKFLRQHPPKEHWHISPDGEIVDLYRFDEAIENLDEHIYWLERKKRDVSEVEGLMEHYRMGSRMIRGVENVAVIDSFVVDKANFLEAYKIHEESGKIGLTGENDCTEFTNGMKDKKILSHRLPGTNQKVLYTSATLGGDWSVPEKVKGLEDLDTDLNYPFMNSDGITLYFAAKGEASLGGYDIFITRYDAEDGSYLKPDNMGFPFNSPFNDYMYAIDDFNDLGWFASDRYQPEGKVCVYVFAPNNSKRVYDYDTTDPALLTNVAMLNGIRHTWNDADKVRIAKQQLAQVMYGGNETQKKGDFRFVVDDNAIYHTLGDFRSADARKKFQLLQQKEKDLDTMIDALDRVRAKYASGNQSTKGQLTPGILDQEKRVKELREEIDRLTLDIRNTEIRKLKNP